MLEAWKVSQVRASQRSRGASGSNRPLVSARYCRIAADSEQGDAGGPVYQHRYPAMWIQVQEFRAALLAMVDANVVQCVGQPQFLEGDGDLESVG